MLKTRARARRFGSFCTFVALSASVTPVLAQEASAGFALNRFDPSERGSDWFWAESLDLRGHNRWAIGLVGDWAYKPLVAYDADGEEVAAIVENQLYAHVGASAIFYDRLRLGVSAPVLLYQNGDDTTTGGGTLEAPSGAAMGDVRLGGDVRLFGEYGGPVTGAVGMHVHLPTGGQDSFSGDGATRLVPRVTVAGDLGMFTYAAKTGVNARFRSEDFAGQPIGHEWTLGAAAGLRLLDKRLTVGPEIWASTVFSDGGDGFFKTAGTPFEGVFGAHYQLKNGLKFGAGVGPGFTQGLGSPEVRSLLSVEWFPEPKEEPASAPMDTDRDGISDDQDACVNEPGVASDDPNKHGCPLPPDTDEDGILDEQDACRSEKGIASDDPMKHGCPPPGDKDGDTINDEQDACPAESGPANPEEPAKHGCPPRDRDGDGILDEVDACVDQAGSPSDDPAKNGCPKAKIEGGQVKILERIEFETGKAAIRPESDDVLRAVLQVLKEHPEISLLSIEGHTDNRGSSWLNRKLSIERAASVAAWLIEQGIDPSRLSSAGFGPDKPVDDNKTEEGRQNNRRVEFHIKKSSAQAQDDTQAEGTAQ